MKEPFHYTSADRHLLNQARSNYPVTLALLPEWRPLRSDLSPDENLPADTRLWAALQSVSGRTWGGCVFYVEAILKQLA